jgi:uncharacterized OB-fold protein
MQGTYDQDSEDDDWGDDTDEESDDGYIPCPHCGETMLEAAEHCPACNRWITNEDMPKKRSSWWVIAVILILLVTMVLSVVPF